MLPHSYGSATLYESFRPDQKGPPLGWKFVCFAFLIAATCGGASFAYYLSTGHGLADPAAATNAETAPQDRHVHQEVLDIDLCQQSCGPNSCGCSSYGECIDKCRVSRGEDEFAEKCANFNLCPNGRVALKHKSLQAKVLDDSLCQEYCKDNSCGCGSYGTCVDACRVNPSEDATAELCANEKLCAAGAELFQQQVKAEKKGKLRAAVLDTTMCEEECGPNSCGCASFGDCVDVCRVTPSDDEFSELCANFNLCTGGGNGGGAAPGGGPNGGGPNGGGGGGGMGPGPGDDKKEGVAKVGAKVLDDALCEAYCKPNSCGCGSYGTCVNTCRVNPSQDVTAEMCANENLCGMGDQKVKAKAMGPVVGAKVLDTVLCEEYCDKDSCGCISFGTCVDACRDNPSEDVTAELCANFKLCTGANMGPMPGRGPGAVRSKVAGEEQGKAQVGAKVLDAQLCFELCSPNSCGCKSVGTCMDTCRVNPSQDATAELCANEKLC